jgi:hypothetical protein
MDSLAKFIRAARGPVLLVTLGVLLAIHQSTRMSFDQTFPVLIIVFGSMWLLERMVPRRMDPSVMGSAAPVTLPPMPPVERDPLFGDDPAMSIHREVYGAPAPVDPLSDPDSLTHPQSAGRDSHG